MVDIAQDFANGGFVLELKKNPNSLESKIEALLTPTITALGYDLIDVEYESKSSAGGAVLRLFIDNQNGTPVSFDDCVRVDQGVDPVIASPEFDAVVPQGFALEVSSPGLDRPLRNAADFTRYAGERVLIKTYRPLSLEEIGNAEYFEHHQKQKNFFGILRGLSGDAVQMETDKQAFRIPFALIAKANLDVSSRLAVEDKRD